MVGGFGIGWFGIESNASFVFIAIFEEIIGGVFGGVGIMKDELA